MTRWMLMLSCLLVINMGCAVPPPLVRSDVLITTVADLPDGAERCVFGKGGPWRVLKVTPDDHPETVLTFIAIFPIGGPFDVTHITCLIPVGDPIMALGEGKDT